MTTMDRTTGLGGSDMAAVLGVDPRRTPLDLYLEKTGEEPGFEGDEVTELGQEFEDKVAYLYTKRTGNRVRRDNREHRVPGKPWAMTHLDRRIVGVKRALEIKCSIAKGWGEEHTDQVPEWVLPQVHWYTGVCDLEATEVAAFLWGGHGPPSLKLYVVERDDEFISFLFEQGGEFWKRVEAREPPDAESSAQMNKRWREFVKGKKVPIDLRTIPLIGLLETVKGDQARLVIARDHLELELKRAFQFTNDEGEIDCADHIVDDQDEPLITWKEQRQRFFDEKRHAEECPDCHKRYVGKRSYRVLRVTKAGKSRAKLEGQVRETEPEKATA